MLRITRPFALLCALLLSACTFLEEPLGGSHSGGAPTSPPAPNPVAVGPINVCAASTGTCADYDAWFARPARPRPGAAIAYTTGDGETDLALYDDGTLLRKVTAKSRGYASWYWDLGDVRAKVSAATLQSILTAIALVKGGSTSQPFFGPGHGSPAAAALFTFDGGKEACASHPRALAAPYVCEAPQPLALLRWQLDVMSTAVHEKWLAATRGTIALMGEVQPAAWPLDPALATAGPHALTAGDYALLGDNDTWTLPDGRYVLAGRWRAQYGGGRIDYQVDVADVEAPASVADSPASLRADLLATNGKLGWSSEWLGISADSTVFPAYKGKRLVVFPRTDADPVARVFRLAAFEQRDLTGEGAL